MLLLTQSYYKKNSILAFTKDWNLFVQYCQSKSVNALPASITAVRRFLEHEAKTRKYSTLKRYAITIGLVHHLLNQKDPTTNIQIRNLLRHLRLEKRGDAKQAECFTRQHLRKLYNQLNHSENSRDIRDLAVYHVMFECALKRSELKRLSFEHLSSTEQEMKYITITDGEYLLSDNAQQALRKWTQLVTSHQGPVFRAIDRHGNIAQTELDDSSIFRILRRAGELLSQHGLSFSGQSTRIGAVKELAQQGYKIKEIQQFGRWLSPAMPNQYLGNLHIAETEKLKFIRFKPLE